MLLFIYKYFTNYISYLTFTRSSHFIRNIYMVTTFVNYFIM